MHLVDSMEPLPVSLPGPTEERRCGPCSRESTEV